MAVIMVVWRGRVCVTGRSGGLRSVVIMFAISVGMLVIVRVRMCMFVFFVCLVVMIVVARSVMMRVGSSSTASRSRMRSSWRVRMRMVAIMVVLMMVRCRRGFWRRYRLRRGRGGQNRSLRWFARCGQRLRGRGARDGRWYV